MKRIGRKTGFLILAGLLLAGAGMAWKIRAERLAVVRPVRGEAVQAVYATGTIEPTVMLPIAPRQGGRLVELLVDEGALVKKGELLARMEDADMQKAIDKLQAEYTLAQSEYTRKRALGKSGAVSKQALDQARTTEESALAALEQAKAQQDYTKLFAPEEGRIIRRDGEIGEFIGQGQAVFWIERPDSLRVTVEVDEEDIPLVDVGQAVVVRADAYPDQVFDGTVQSITPKGDPVSRSYRVRMALTGKTPLMSGMTAETNIIVQTQKNALLVPASAVKDQALWVVEAGRLVHKTVETGIKGPERIQILSGLSGEEEIVKTPVPSLQEGQFVGTVPETVSP